MNVKIAGVVLAGGQSLRMGQDKALLTLEQHTLLVRAVKLLQETGISDCFVSGNYPDFDCIRDQHSGLGPLAGIAACANQLSVDYDAVFVIPVDMPLLSVQDCTVLVEAYLNSASPQEAVPQTAGLYYQEAIFPLILTLNTPLHDYLADIINTPHKKHRSLYRLFETLSVKGISAKATDIQRFENTNTPEQWQRCLTLYSRLQRVK